MAATPDAPFELFGGHPALDFANTLDDRYVPGGPVDRVPTYERLLAFVEEVGLLPGNVARRIRRTTSRAEGARVLERVAALRSGARRCASLAQWRIDRDASRLDRRLGGRTVSLERQPARSHARSAPLGSGRIDRITTHFR
jgi:hypothetical protein